MTEMHAVLLIAVTALVTIVIRAIPFVLFGGDKELPASVRYLGQVLPPAIMAALVIYCLKGVDLTVMPRGLAELLAVAVVLGVTALVQKISGVALGGFTTVILLLLFSSSLIMICLGIIGYYIARIYDEIKGRPRYIISKTCGERENKA